MRSGTKRPGLVTCPSVSAPFGACGFLCNTVHIFLLKLHSQTGDGRERERGGAFLSSLEGWFLLSPGNRARAPGKRTSTPHGQEYINQHKYDLSSKLRGVLHPFQKQSFGSKSMSVD